MVVLLRYWRQHQREDGEERRGSSSLLPSPFRQSRGLRQRLASADVRDPVSSPGLTRLARRLGSTALPSLAFPLPWPGLAVMLATRL
jgi:hypothetical protein